MKKRVTTVLKYSTLLNVLLWSPAALSSQYIINTQLFQRVKITFICLVNSINQFSSIENPYQAFIYRHLTTYYSRGGKTVGNRLLWAFHKDEMLAGWPIFYYIFRYLVSSNIHRSKLRKLKMKRYQTIKTIFNINIQKGRRKQPLKWLNAIHLTKSYHSMLAETSLPRQG